MKRTTFLLVRALSVLSLIILAVTVGAVESVVVERGTFRMGDIWGGGRGDERPAHQVTFTYDFYLGKTPVTFEEYDRFCEETGRTKPSDEGWGRGNRPAVNVSWWDAIAFCNWLSEREGLPVAYRLKGESDEGQMLDAHGNVTMDITEVIGYRLPTEAEWEYAARGGIRQHVYRYSGSNVIDNVAWYWENSYNERFGMRTTMPVMQKTPNVLGLYDMSGNVWEWTTDRWHLYTPDPALNPYLYSSLSRMMKGGSFLYPASASGISYRFSATPELMSGDLGFRVARTRLE